MHAIELDGEKLAPGERAEIQDGAGDLHAAVVIERVGPLLDPHQRSVAHHLACGGQSGFVRDHRA